MFSKLQSIKFMFLKLVVVLNLYIITIDTILSLKRESFF